MNQQRLRQILLSSVHVNDESKCWVWSRQISNSGYGRVHMKDDEGHNYIETASRAAYMAFCGELDLQHRVKQTCGNRLCINPDHLTLESR